jgi:hypothetical protein
VTNSPKSQESVLTAKKQMFGVLFYRTNNVCLKVGGYIQKMLFGFLATFSFIFRGGWVGKITSKYSRQCNNIIPKLIDYIDLSIDILTNHIIYFSTGGQNFPGRGDVKKIIFKQKNLYYPNYKVVLQYNAYLKHTVFPRLEYLYLTSCQMKM